jgi:hypothetical protein
MTPTIRVRLVLLATLIAAEPAGAQARFELQDATGTRWYRGNTHAHTSLTDGDSSPETVAAWYRSHGYAFLVITDHDQVTDPAGLKHLTDSAFVLVPGEEVTARHGALPVHVNAIGLASGVAPQAGASVAATLQANVDAVRAAGGVPQANHPNFVWAVDEEDLFGARGLRLFELFNGHPLVNNSGGGGEPGTEELWDRLLTRGKRIYGVASDDSHHFTEEFAPRRANPGRGWVVVRAAALEPAAIARALDEGMFYSSTGVELEDVAVTRDRIEILIRPAHPHFRYRTEFIGAGGRVLQETTANPAVFTLVSPEPYVRAKIYGSDGSVAWVQPLFTTRPDS